MRFLPVTLLRISLWAFILLFGLLSWQASPSWLKQFDWLAHDQIVRYAASDKLVDEIVLVDIDEESLQLLSPWPWPRSLLAQLLERLDKAQVKAIGVDIVFPDKTDASEDAALMRTVELTKAILPIIWDYQNVESHLAVGSLAAASNHNQNDNSICYPAYGYVTSFAELNEKAFSLGHISPVPDEQGLMRFIPPIVCVQGKSYSMLALSMLSRYYDQAPSFRFSESFLTVTHQDHVKQIDLESGLWNIPYRYNINAFTNIPAWRFFSDQVGVDISGKAVIIGSSAVGLNDRVATPLLPIAPGMLLHAQMFVDLVNTKPLYGNQVTSLYVLWTAISLLILALVIMNYSIWVAVITWVFLSFLQIIFALMIYQYFNGLVPLSTSLLLLLLLFVAQSIMEWSIVKKESYRIYTLFKDYLPDAVLAQLSKNPSSKWLTPQHREVTVLFADLVDFTRMTESMPTTEAAALTREVLSLLTQAIHNHQGTLDKYMGDAVMAFWNAPLDQVDHRLLAIKAAIAMRASMTRLNQQRSAEGKPLLAIHVGINTGEALVGDLGTEWRHAYTVLGDAINVAQRLMTIANELNTDIVIGQETASCCASELTSKGLRQLTGRVQSVEVFVISVTDKA